MVMILEVTTRPRADDTHDVFVHHGDDDPCHVGIITKVGRRDWQAADLIYGTKAGAAHDMARRGVAAGMTPYEHDYSKVTYAGLGVRDDLLR